MTPLAEGARFSLIAQGMVFLVLFLLALVILAMKLVFYRPGGRKAAAEPPVGEGDVQEPQDKKKLAAIAAALQMHREAAPPVVGAEGPWAPNQPSGRTPEARIRSRRWSDD